MAAEPQQAAEDMLMAAEPQQAAEDTLMAAEPQKKQQTGDIWSRDRRVATRQRRAVVQMSCRILLSSLTKLVRLTAAAVGRGLERDDWLVMVGQLSCDEFGKSRGVDRTRTEGLMG